MEQGSKRSAVCQKQILLPQQIHKKLWFIYIINSKLFLAWKFNLICINKSLQCLGSSSDNFVYARLRNNQAGVVPRQPPQGELKNSRFESIITPTRQLFIPPSLCQPGKGASCCSFSQTQHGQGQLCAGGGCTHNLHTQPSWEGPLRNAFTRCRFHAGYERVKRALGKHNKQMYKYQRDLKAIVSFSQWLFKDSEYLDSFSFPVRNQRIFLEMFLLFRHLSNSGSL